MRCFWVVFRLKAFFCRSEIALPSLFFFVQKLHVILMQRCAYMHFSDMQIVGHITLSLISVLDLHRHRIVFTGGRADMVAFGLEAS